jgi:hypothetical protein
MPAHAGFDGAESLQNLLPDAFLVLGSNPLLALFPNSRKPVLDQAAILAASRAAVITVCTTPSSTCFACCRCCISAVALRRVASI